MLLTAAGGPTWQHGLGNPAPGNAAFTPTGKSGWDDRQPVCRGTEGATHRRRRRWRRRPGRRRAKSLFPLRLPVAVVRRVNQAFVCSKECRALPGLAWRSVLPLLQPARPSACCRAPGWPGIATFGLMALPGPACRPIQLRPKARPGVRETPADATGKTSPTLLPAVQWEPYPRNPPPRITRHFACARDMPWRLQGGRGGALVG